jgi:CheY-like chemotaxis protein/HPt (histidine-containing phosphotransfer) domain-containing protein
MGGNIEVESQPGFGSVFKVSMPFQFGAPAGPEESYTEDPGLKPLRGKFILLVEDDPLICELVNHTLENFGAKVVTSNNGNDAIQVFGKSNIDLVLVDIQLPGRSGTEIITTIRNEFQGAKSKIPVIAMTANVMLHDINHWLKEGMSDFITKPFRDAELIAKISKLLEIPITESVQTKTPVFDPVPVLIEPQKQKDKLYDLKELIETSNGNSEFTRKMINLFLTSSFASLNNLRFHLRQKNWDQLGKTAHRMLGSYKQLGINHVVVLLKELETLCSGEQELGRAAWLVNEIDKHSLEVSGLLKSELHNYS